MFHITTVFAVLIMGVIALSAIGLSLACFSSGVANVIYDDEMYDV